MTEILPDPPKNLADPPKVLPAPLVPADCDLRDFAFMPLDVTRLRRSKAWRICKRQPEIMFYMLNLWSASWHEVPAASLEDDDEALADDAACDPKRWGKIKDLVLHGWIKCSDGRLYHPVVAEKALTAWASKQTQRQRTEKARETLAQKRSAASTEKVTETTTETPTETVTASKGEGEGEGEGKGKGEGKGEEGSASLRSAGAAAPSANEPEPPPDPKDLLWKEGLAILRTLTAKGDGPNRRVLGKMVDAIAGDHLALLAILRKAEIEQPDGPIAWIRAAISSQTGLLAAVTDGPPDPWGINAWAARQTDLGTGTGQQTGETGIAINGWMVLDSAQMVADAAGLPESWRGNWDAMGAWMREDVQFTFASVLVAIGEQAFRMGGDIRSIAVFDSTVRMIAKRVAA